MPPRPETISTSFGVATVVPTRYFLKHVLPPLHPNIDVDKVLVKLRRHRKGSQKAITKAGRWWGFAKDPAEVERPKTGFSHFPKLVDAIAKCGAPKGTNPSLQVLHNPEPTTYGENRHIDELPDAYMVAPSIDRTKVSWADVAVIGEYEKYFPNSAMSSERLAQSTLRAFKDPRRRFVYGYTLDDMAMRLWFRDRSQFIVSRNFNFITNHEPIVYFFLSLLYAETHHLGWDPTVRVISCSNNKPQYEYTVENVDGSTSTFRTLRLISQVDSVQGKGTRVWKVVLVVNGVPVGAPAVLKDHWIQEEFEFEGTTLSRIQRSDNSEDFQRTFSSNFLTVLSHGGVIMRSQRHAPYCDRTRQHIRNAKASKLDVPLPDAGFFGPRPYVPSHLVSKQDPFLTGCRLHYRIVFKEYCTALRSSTPLSIVFTALAQLCEALKLLHEAGWVHRDISDGNIMLDELGHARLMDLEYAKRLGDETTPDLRIGTSPFMSAEVARQAYSRSFPSPQPMDPRYCPLDPALSPRSQLYKFAREHHLSVSPGDSDETCSLNLEFKIAEAMWKKDAQLLERGEDRPAISPASSIGPEFQTPSPERAKVRANVSGVIDFGFRYNPLHDLESLFWIATYFLFNATPEDRDATMTVYRKQITQRLLHEEEQRDRCIRLDGCYRYDLDVLPKNLRKLGLVLEDWRSQLTAAFYDAEKDCASITPSTGSGLHEQLARTLQKMSELAGSLHDGPSTCADTETRKRRLDDASDSQTPNSDALTRPKKKARTVEAD
ncbi:hypothetical protein NM688_g5672 [Phlebia brevispora]|uniref:Uncharacterized protein n=1 Tax=Phlebia brevispora TaxID=194682 RepID=A0ACC1SRI6_9APHY|nr:hypothetical protein NM688_g5672 [Phlebia brevispora]